MPGSSGKSQSCKHLRKLIAFACAALALGCGESSPPAARNAQTDADAARSAGVADAAFGRRNSINEPSDIRPASFDTNPTLAFLHQPFNQAIRREPPSGPNVLPPETTISGKSVGKLYVEVQKLWPAIHFADASGKELRYTAEIETDQGSIAIDLLADVAPNHVRSFVALARVGYYDGLRFETRTGTPNVGFPPHSVAGGSPAGDGNDLGGVGYWLNAEILKPDLAAKRGIKHEPGTVGAVHGYEQPNSDSCRFYICLGDAPVWDGDYTIFGKVTRGLDAARALFGADVQDDKISPATFIKPPTIRRVTISVRTLETTPHVPNNE
jgi:cyclophilin family peptidyl-prolyl cis-trans isomerase